VKALYEAICCDISTTRGKELSKNERTKKKMTDSTLIYGEVGSLCCMLYFLSLFYLLSL
jgi:hypothetical protein